MRGTCKDRIRSITRDEFMTEKKILQRGLEDLKQNCRKENIMVKIVYIANRDIWLSSLFNWSLYKQVSKDYWSAVSPTLPHSCLVMVQGHTLDLTAFFTKIMNSITFFALLDDVDLLS